MRTGYTDKKATILCCTQSDAMRISRILGSNAIRGSVVRPTRTRADMSCSWGVEISAANAERAGNCLRSVLMQWRWLE